MKRFGHDWALCGGWAVDAWLGRQTREHLDVDLSIFDDDQGALHRFFGEGWLLNGHDPHDDDSTQPWDGHRLEVPAHIHARGDGLDLDFQVNHRQGSEWLFSSGPRLTLALDRAVRESRWGMPTLAPEAILFHKAQGTIRPHDQSDFDALLPTLGADQRRWLGAAIEVVQPGHPWLPRLGAAPHRR